MSLFSDIAGFQAPHGGTIPPHILVTAFKPDLFIFSEVSQEVVLFELTCPWDTNIVRSHNYKSEKYSPLVADLSRNRIVSFYSIEISARGQITKENQSRLKSFLHKCCNCTRSFKAMIRIASQSCASLFI